MNQVLSPPADGTGALPPAWILRLERAGDRLSPILVKEIRQIVKGRDFIYSFGISLAIGLGVAFLGAADAMTNSAGSAGTWTFTALTTCLALLGFAIVPLGAFNTLRNERLEQTFDLIALTALTPRRIVVGKLLAQAVKLSTMFAGMAPFIATSFLLGGVDFVTICVALALVFGLSVWICAACLFVSAIPRSRAMSGFVFAGLGVGLAILFFVVRTLVAQMLTVRFGFFAGVGFPTRPAASSILWVVAGVSSAAVLSLVNLVLLAENRLTESNDDRSTALRAGFLMQFALALGWALSFVGSVPTTRQAVVDVLGVYAAIHLAIVGAFTVTEQVPFSRRVQLRLAATPRWRRWLVILRPGPRWAAAYIAVQMASIFPVAWALGASGSSVRWLLAMCGFVALFTGVPTAAIRAWRPSTPSWILRAAILFVLAASLILPDVLHFVFWRPDVFSLVYAARHLANPVRTLANWRSITRWGWEGIAVALAIGGFLSYLTVFTWPRRRGSDRGPQPLLPSIQVPADERQADGSGGR